MISIEQLIIIHYLPPGELAHAGHGHSDGGVEVTPGDAPRHHHAQHHPDSPAAQVTH